jgi:hypothetical protein
MRYAPIVLLAILIAPAIQAADIVTPLGIDKVTVYRDGGTKVEVLKDATPRRSRMTAATPARISGDWQANRARRKPSAAITR